MSKKNFARRQPFDENDSMMNIIVTAKNQEQKDLLKEFNKNTITLVRGPAGCGKTFVAITHAIQQLFKNKCEKIILTRPVVEAAGEKLGYLPGDFLDKIDPYMMPIYEFLAELVNPDILIKILPKSNGNGNGGKNSMLRVIPLAYMRGLTFKNSIIVADESQNSTPEQFRMLLTRLGENSRMIICGDTRQSDIRGTNGLQDAFDLLQGVEGMGFVTMTENAIVRHPIIQSIEQRYEERINKKSSYNPS